MIQWSRPDEKHGIGEAYDLIERVSRGGWEDVAASELARGLNGDGSLKEFWKNRSVEPLFKGFAKPIKALSTCRGGRVPHGIGMSVKKNNDLISMATFARG